MFSFIQNQSFLSHIRKKCCGVLTLVKNKEFRCKILPLFSKQIIKKSANNSMLKLIRGRITSFFSQWVLVGLVFFISVEGTAGFLNEEDRQDQADLYNIPTCNQLDRDYQKNLPENCLEKCRTLHSELEDSDTGYARKEKWDKYQEHISSCKQQAQANADTDNKVASKATACTSTCNQYLNTVASGCSGISGDSCTEFCNNTEHSSSSFMQADQMQGFNESSGVNNCVTQKVEQYKSLYMQECASMLEEINQTKPNELLCPSAELSNNTEKCTEFCQEQLNEHFNSDEQINPTECYSEQRNMVSRSGFLIPNASPISKQCQVVLNNSEGEVNGELNTLQASIIKSNGELKQGFTWFFCEKGEEQNCEEDLKLAFEEAAEICATLQKEAHECCHTPEQCVGGGLATALDGLGKMHIGISSLKGPKKACKAVRQTFGLFSSMQGAMATQCTRKANACQEGCAQEQRRVAEQFKQACNHDIRIKADYDENEHTCDEQFFKHYRSQYKKSGWSAQEDINISLVPEQCERTGREANRNIQAMSTNLGTSLMASMKECGETGEPLKWETPKPPKIPRYTRPDIPTPSPRPVPTPSPYLGGGGREPPPNRPKKRGLPTPNTPGPAADPLGVEPDLPDDPAKDGPGAPGGMGGLLGGSGGSSGMGGFGLSGGGGGGSPGGEGNDDDSPKGNKILHGYAGGKFAGYGGGGSANQGGRKFKRSAKNKKNRRKLARLNLKKILPKGKQMNHKVGKFGSPHDNIFQRMSNRYQWLCRTNKMNCK